jgi:type VI secretion system protein ImpF
MSRVDPNQGLTPSILDRLIDPDSAGTAWRRGYGLEQMVASVHRDLEDLLNTRQSHAALPERYPAVHDSLVAYGLPELTSANLTPEHMEAIGRMLEAVISRYEPRLRDVRATVVPTGEENEGRTVRFRVEARLCLEPAPEVAFDTTLELATGHYSVRPSDA